MQNPIDLERCRKGMKQLDISGVPRPELIEEAIRRIQADPTAAMSAEYLGIKNYASFGDQREDHSYGMGPKHGTIVFSIGRASSFRPGALDADALYLLEACRDFGFKELARRDERNRFNRFNLCGVIRMLDEVNAERNVLLDAIQAVNIEAHV